MLCENLAMFSLTKKVSLGKQSGMSYCRTLIETHIMGAGHQIMDHFRPVFPIMGSVDFIYVVPEDRSESWQIILWLCE